MNTSPKVTPTNTSLRDEILSLLYTDGASNPEYTADKLEVLLTAKTTEAREQAWQAGYNQGVVDGRHSMTGEHNPDTDTEQLQQLDKEKHE